MKDNNIVPLYSPFIPQDKFSDFNVSLWTGIISGLITGIVTGIFVGLILWKFQNRHENKQQHIQSEREVNVFLQQLKVNLQTSPALILSTDPSQFIPTNVNNLIEFVMKNPLDVWSNNLRKEYKTEIQILLEIVNLYLKFKSASSKLEPVVNFWLIKEFDSLNYSFFIAPLYGIINDYNIEELKVYQQMPSLSDERIEKIRDFIKGDEMKDITSQYVSYRKDFLEKVKEFTNLIGL